MTPDQLSTALETLNHIDRSIGGDKHETYKLIDQLRNHLCLCVDNVGIDPFSTVEAIRLQSILGTADPRNQNPGAGLWGMGDYTGSLIQGGAQHPALDKRAVEEQKQIAHTAMKDLSDDD